MKSLFISDLHLSLETPHIAQQLLAVLAGPAQEVDQLFILGDMFEAWIGDDAMPPELAPLLMPIKALTEKGIAVYFMHGNRDFLIGEKFAQACGAQLLNDPHVIELQGENVLLMHGDLLCSDDTTYLAFRQQVRNPQWQAHFLSLSIEERIAMAQQARAASKTDTSNKAEDIMDTNQNTVEDYMREHGVKRLIHGHTHRPAIHHFELDGAKAERIVLGDWGAEPSMLFIDDDSVRLIDPRVSS
jgi:UDP-2,3-diacylglucosamine hydrolase